MIGNLVILVVFSPLLTILNGWVLTKLWDWFVVPTFGLPVLGLAAGCGIALIVKFLTHQTTNNEKDIATFLSKSAANSIANSLVFLAVGWIISGFM